MFVAERAGAPVGASLIAVDEPRLTAYGRYWGALQPIDCLHFEACYYRPLQWCIEHGYLRFEGGAQGEHKMARGLLPARTHSAHRLAHPAFARAVEDYLRAEGRGIDAYVDELAERDPFRRNS
jgi:predicted N-acyltransferase